MLLLWITRKTSSVGWSGGTSVHIAYLYSVLGVTRSATEAEIKRAFRALSKKYHPDVNPGDREAEERFRKVSEAYSLLQDPQKRKEYDKKLEEGKRGVSQKAPSKSEFTHQGTSGINFGDMERQFARFFGFQPGQTESNDEIHKEGKTRANPIDMTEMFVKYMGIPK